MDSIQKQAGFEQERLYVLPEYITRELLQSELTRSLFVSDIGYFPHAKYHYRERPEGSDAHIFIYCTAGQGWVELSGDKTIQVSNQSLIVIPAGTPHRYGASTDNPWSIYWFHLQGEHAAQLISLYELAVAPMLLPAISFAKWVESFNPIFELLANKTYELPTHVHVSQTIRYLLSSLGISMANSTHSKKRDRYLEDAIRYMTDHLADSIKLPELAQYTGVSKQHLIHIFNQKTGVPPVEYFLRMKMQQAGQMLDLTDLNVKEIGNAIGISDPYYFSRLFKKIMGYSPTEYRSIPKG
jgi:AraC-like DNA-binding protein